MSGLLDYMAGVTLDSYEETDAPVVGYGNELLWEDIKVDPVNSDALLPARTRKRTTRQKKVK